MQSFFLGNLTAVPLAQPNPTGVQGTTGGEEGDAFQLLLESMLFENLAGQLFRGNGGLLAGAKIGRFPEEGQEGDQKQGDELLALLEMLQTPLLEQLRLSQPQAGLPIGIENQGESASTVSLFGRMNLMANLTNPNETISAELSGEQNMGLVSQELIGMRETGLETSLSERNSGPLSETISIDKGAKFLSELAEEMASKEGVTLESQGETMTELKGEQVLPENGAGREFGSLSLMSNQNSSGLEKASVSNQLTENSRVPSGLGYTELADQLIQSGKLKLLGAKQEMEIQLKPEYLGKLAIRLTLENGAMTARFLVESHHVGRMLDNNLHQLRQTLEEQGVRFDQVQVEVGDPGSSFQERQREWGNHRNQTETTPLGIIENNDTAENSQELSSSGSIDYRA